MLLVVSRDCKADVDCYSDFGSVSKGGDKFKRKQVSEGWLEERSNEALRILCLLGSSLRSSMLRIPRRIYKLHLA